MTEWPRDDPDLPGAHHAASVEPVSRPGPDARSIAAGYLRRRLVVDVVLLVVGGLLLGTCIGGFTYLARRLDHLARTGVLATATAVAVDNTAGRFESGQHVVVSFRVNGDVVFANPYTGGGTGYVVGEPVVIVYDANDPSTAQLATDPSFGPAGTPFLLFGLVGVLVALPGAYGLLVRRGARAALRGPDRRLTAARAGRRRVVLQGTREHALAGLELKTHGQVKRLPAGEPAPMCAYGTGAVRAMLVLVDPVTDAVLYGRVPETSEE
jgi:hypothetical protein